jgi:anthranilate/para-aminobenzoate synthase component I
MWLRLSEQFPFAAVTEPVAIHRKANAESDQMSSNASALCKQALHVQQMALTRSRAQSGERAKRREVRSKLRDRAYEISITEATNLIHAGDVQTARARLRDAFHFRPFRALASGRLPWLLIK